MIQIKTVEAEKSTNAKNNLDLFLLFFFFKHLFYLKLFTILKLLFFFFSVEIFYVKNNIIKKKVDISLLNF